MKITITNANLQNFSDIVNADDKSIVRSGVSRYASDSDKVKFDVSPLSDIGLKELWSFLDAKADDRSATMARNNVKQWMDLKVDPSGTKITKLDAVPAVLKAFIAKTEHKYLFRQSKDGNLLANLVTNIEYIEPRSRDSDAPPKVSLSMVNFDFTKSEDDRDALRMQGESISFYAADIRGKTAAEMLQEKGLYLETPETMQRYNAEMEAWTELRNRTGVQVNVVGKAIGKAKWWAREFRTVESDGEPARMVVDPLTLEMRSMKTECKFWASEEEKRIEGQMPLMEVPVHPYVRLFHLAEHVNYAAHINNLSLYKYDTSVGKKLVLPAEVKELLEILISHASNNFKDIVSGKAGGVIVLCQGLPGCGKTLTAEIYSEVMQKPLYKVQASQLGVSIDGLEEELMKVLARSEKWGAILLIDEADVYVHARGSDINQNAIVGVFLRVLEYYKGVLFMTTNKGMFIDDAIGSRLTARIDYDMPTESDRYEIWNIIANQNGVQIASSEIRELSEQELSGRDIKNLLKLAQMVAHGRNVPITAKLVMSLMKFKAIH